jgi:hypothetical protein
MSEHQFEFDADGAWDGMVPDQADVDRRYAARNEHDRREEERREKARREADEARGRKAEANELRMRELELTKDATRAANYTRWKHMEEQQERMKEGKRQAQKAWMEAIRAAELVSDTGSPHTKRIEDVGHTELCATEDEAEEMRRWPVSGSSSMPEPFPGGKTPPDGGGLDLLRPVYTLEGGSEDPTVHKQYKSLCADLYAALDCRLYAFDNNLAKNLTNPLTRRLRSYYESIKREEYGRIDLEDAWAKLFQLVMLIEPECSHNEGAHAHALTQMIYHVSTCFEATLRKLTSYCRINLTGSDATKDDLSLLTAVFRTAIRMSEQGEPSRLHAAALRRARAVHALMNSARDGPDVETMRSMTLEIMTHCAQYFAENPNDAGVAALRRIALGKSQIDFNATKRAWVDAIKGIPDQSLPPSSVLWADAVKHAGLLPGDWASRTKTCSETLVTSRTRGYYDRW